MQFTKLRLQGFKSFVDPTELVIAPGLTGVVGPNGCGKSNLLEALRWVMGETRASAMRGGGMEDVIFAGASSRPARHYAEVSLHLDNSERLAPPDFNHADTLEVVRRITREAGSAYKANGKEARARDVQMLFADASTGAHSPALVRQGQIAELINAKPKARRRILEEAAGISGLYQRRHEAELKLKATETNLARIEDVLEALRTQLSTLEKQARQATRYRELSRALRRAEGVLLYVRWREADAERAAAEEAGRAAVAAAAAAQGAAGRAAKTRAEAAEAVPPLREEDAVAGAILQRELVARDRLDDQERQAGEAARAAAARIAQLSADAEREAALNRDAGERIRELEWEARAIDRARDGQGEALATAEAETSKAATELRDRESGLDQLTEETARLAARHQSAERRVAEAEAQIARIVKDKAAAEEAAARLSDDHKAAGDAATRARQAAEEAERHAATAEAALDAAEAKRAEAQAAEGAARGARAEAEGGLAALGAELGALERVLSRGAADGPQILDACRAAPGFEAAFGAALGDDLRAPETEAGSGWHGADGTGDADLPEGVDPIAPHVDAPASLARRLAQTGVVATEDGPRLQAMLRPGQRIVSRAGDLWRWDGFVARAADAPSAAALRLTQQNQLAALKAQVEEASSAAETAIATHDAAATALSAAQDAEAKARTHRKETDIAASETARQAARAETAEATLAARLETVEAARVRRTEEVGEAEAALSQSKEALETLDDLGAARAALETRRTEVDTARATVMEARQALDDLRREVDTRESRAKTVATELKSWRARLETAETRAGELKERIAAANAEREAADAVPAEIAEARMRLMEAISTAEARCRASGDALAAAEAALREAETEERNAERAAGEAREARARTEALSEAAAERATAAAARIEEAHGGGPEHLLNTLDLDPEALPSPDALETEAARLTRQRDAMGAVNLRAEEDRTEVAEEHDTLEAEKNDLEAAVTQLRQGIAGLNREGRTRLLAAFEEVNRNFTSLFKTLFGGGEAELVLVESDDPLEAGLELMCQPPGKKLSTLSLLSGGEQTLTALSLIFAVFLANPAPICVLDEVDAPLDDANVTRFCDLLDEMIRRTDTRFLLITHHAVTMSRMDRLFGVTMAEQGVSQLVSVDLARAEELVDA